MAGNLSTRETPSTHAEHVLAAARGLAPRIRAARRQIEVERRLPDDIFRAMAEAGVFRAHLPPEVGGSGATLSELAPVVEEIARADGSAGWLAYVGSEAVRQTMLLPKHVARDIMGQSPYLFIAGMFTPSGAKAIAVEGGYRVSGRWKTCSGSLHSNWIIGGALVYDGDTLRIGPNGRPVSRLNFIPSSEVTILDTWYVGGLRGTNSNDLETSDVFVPEEYGAYNVEPPDVGVHLMVPLGIARAAMEEFVQLAAVKGPVKARGSTYRELPAVQREVAAAEAALRAARCWAYEVLADVDRRVAAGEPITSDLRNTFFMAAHHAGRVAVQVVDTLHTAAGTAGIFDSSPLLHCLQDVHTVVAHTSLQAINLEPAGKMLLGLE